jgi:L-alanine-DL-glutamate epimerase-like enolase superfamily enzyme
LCTGQLLFRQAYPISEGGADGRGVQKIDRAAHVGRRAGFSLRCHWYPCFNAGAHHEFKGLQTDVPFECRTSPLKVVDGKIKVLTGPGLGVEIDPGFIKKHRPVTA